MKNIYKNKGQSMVLPKPKTIERLINYSKGLSALSLNISQLEGFKITSKN